ncbi:helix-turn-helix transcriptional regulator [Marinobacterium lutimaris]|uniref:Transcriptional regulator, AlpA family n=1 Tax=Marinobacterium lutimaris TaxID=568106 RepID=A0A1H5VT16_9GAMM|nr:AlpA family transcriptional regulator [Marinobacterium lutimaris]SEF90273.1 transcriptional regulator, AlpA family [Marinobacterium lutimaris]
MRLIRQSEVSKLTGLSRASIYRQIDEGRFPKSVSIGGRSVAWVEEEINEWIEARIAERDDLAN